MIMTMQRQIRNDLLAMSDWTQLPDNSLTDAKRAEWATYRQQLRDLNVDGDDPTGLDWPLAPGV